MAHFYRFNPPFVSQGSEAHCWAAAMESWLACVVGVFGEKGGTWNGISTEVDGSAWRRRRQTKDKLLNDYKDQEDSDGSLKGHSMEPYRTLALDFGMEIDFLDPAKLTLAYMRTKLEKFGHLYMTYFSNVMRHAVVVYGVSDADGLAVMDPNPDVKYTHRKIEFFKTPERLKEWITVGWATK